MNLSLSGQKLKELQHALLDAFPEKASLEEMLYFGLNKNLNEIATGTNLQEIVFKLIKKATSENWVENLIDAAHNANPGNPRLKNIVDSRNKPQGRSEQSNTKQVTRLVITLDGIDAEEFIRNKKIQEAFLLLTQEASGDASVDFKKIEEGSIKITLSGTPEGLERLAALIHSGELGELRKLEELGLSIEDANLIVEDAKEEDKSAAKNEISRLAQEIRENRVRKRYLSGANLSGANLSGAYLSDADLSGANLIGAKLSGAKLSGANLSGAYFFLADLSDANLSGAKLSDADLSRANLSYAYFFLADLGGANLSDANLSGAKLSRAKLNRADLSRADLSRAKLSGANLNDAYLSDAYLSGADLSDAYLTSANLTSANLSDADLSGADLSGANVENARFGHNQGISKELKRDLIRRGAIFEDSPGDSDRSRVLVPH